LSKRRFLRLTLRFCYTADMDEKPDNAEPNRRWYQYSLRTLLIGVTLAGVLLRQWPLLEWVPPEYGIVLSGTSVYSGSTIIPWTKIEDGYYFVPRRVWVVLSAEAAALTGWCIWRRLRSRKTAVADSACTRS